MLICTKNTALGDVSWDKYSTRLRVVLYLSLDTPPHAVFSVQTCGSALKCLTHVLNKQICFFDKDVSIMLLFYNYSSVQ